MKHTLFLLALAATCGMPGLSSTQAQERRAVGAEERMVGAARGAHPVVAALDTNGDGVIDEKEIASAPAALQKLDKNGDGKLAEDELRPAMPPSSMLRTGASGAGAQMVTRLMEFDKNGDGKLSKAELPERMQMMMERADLDKDGFMSKDEIRRMTESNLVRPAAREGREVGESGGRLPPALTPAK